jgi:hypothetical protein
LRADDDFSIQAEAVTTHEEKVIPIPLAVSQHRLQTALRNRKRLNPVLT